MDEPDLSLWIVNQYASHEDESGGARHHNLGQCLTARAFNVTIISGGNASPPRTADGVNFLRYRILAYKRNGLRRLVSMIIFSFGILELGIRRPASVRRPDIIIGSSPHPFGALAALLLARRYGSKFVLEVRDVWPASLVEIAGLPRNHPLIWLLGRIEAFLYRHAELIVSPLANARDRVNEVIGSPGPRFLHISNGVDIARFPHHAVSNHHQFLVAYAGAHGPPNALFWLLKAAALVAAEPQVKPIRFLLVGDGIQRDELKAFAHEANLTSVTMRPGVPRADIPAILGSADALILPGNRTDLYRYGFSPNKLFEYMASGRPVLSAIQAPRHPVIEASAGLNVLGGDERSLASAVLALAAATASERQAMGTRGRKYVMDNATYDGLAETLACALRQLTNRPKSATA